MNTHLTMDFLIKISLQKWYNTFSSGKTFKIVTKGFQLNYYSVVLFSYTSLISLRLFIYSSHA